MDEFKDELESFDEFGGCDEMSALLQPFIDDELEGRDRESMAAHLTDCDACRGEVQSQHHVRAAMQQLELAAVPEALLARIREELDRVDLEDANGVVRLSDAAPPSRARAFARGVGMMLPAAAAAVALFFVVRANPSQESAEAAGMLPGATDKVAATQVAAPPVPEPAAGPAATPIARQSLPAGIELVGGEADPATGAYHYADRRSGHEFRGFVDPAGSKAPTGTRQMFRGQAYFLSHDGKGRAQVQVQRGGMLYTFVEVTGSPVPAGASNVDIEAPSFRRLVAFAASLDHRQP